MSEFELDDDNLSSQHKQEKRTGNTGNNDFDRPAGAGEKEQDFRGLRMSKVGQQQFRATIGGVSDEALQTMVRIFENAKDHESPTLDASIRRDRFKILPMSSVNGNANPAALFTLDLANDGYKKILTYIVVFEQPGPVQTRPLVDNRESYESLILPEDQLNHRYSDRIRVQLGASADQLLIVSSQVILAETTRILTTSTNEDTSAAKSVVASIVNNAIDALSGYRDKFLSRIKGTPLTDTSLTPKALDNNGRMEVTYDYPVTQETDTSGLPIRADIKANVVYSVPNVDDFDDHTHDRIPVGTISAVLDLYLDDSDISHNSFRTHSRKEVVDEPFWQAVLDVTSIGGTSALPFSLELAQYLLSQMALQTNDYRWVRMLRPRAVVSSEHGMIKPLIDLGWLNFYNPDPSLAVYAEGLSSNTSDDDLSEYLAGVIRPKPTLGMTIPTSGEKSWVLGIFERIATTEGTERQGLIDMLYQSADVLTGGVFLELAHRNGLLDSGESPVVSIGSREIIGVWTDENGTVRSASEWNVPAVASALGDKPDSRDLVREYQLTYEGKNSGRSMDYNLSRRWDMQRRHVCGNIRPVGTAEKLMLNPHYIATLSEAISKTSLNPIYNNDSALSRRHRAGSTAYSQFSGSDLGSQGRRRDNTVSGRNRSIFSNNNLF